MSARHRYVLDQASAIDAERAGGKAATLARLASAFAVPEFFVITTNGFTADGMKSSARTRVLEAVAALGEGPFAVRSSAREEDGAEHAHAGQYETELGVHAENVCDVAERVWRSGFSASLAQYRSARGLSAAPHPPAIIVQRMIEPRAAGVAFSACPVSGDRDVVRIGAVTGRGDKLVGGDVDGDAYVVSIDDAVHAESADGRALSYEDCRDVAALARACEARLGAPQDIEWAFDGAQLYLLQARPITTLRDIVIWDNSNIVESYPGIVSPLTYSFARHVYANVYRAFARLMGVPTTDVEANGEAFDELLGRIDGRVYYNLINWYRVLALFPGFKANRAFMEQMMGVSEALPRDLAERIAPPVNGVWARLADNARLARVGAGLVFHSFTLKRTSARFRARLDVALRTPNATIDAMPASELAREYRRIEHLLLARWDAPLINDFLCMIAFGVSRKVIENWAGAPGLALHGDMLIGQGDIISAEPARRIRAMGEIVRGHPHLIERLAAGDIDAVAEAPALAAAFDAYVARFGDRCVQELKLESPSLHDDSTPLLLAIAASARAPRGERAAPEPMSGYTCVRCLRVRPSSAPSPGVC